MALRFRSPHTLCALALCIVVSGLWIGDAFSAKEMSASAEGEDYSIVPVTEPVSIEEAKSEEKEDRAADENKAEAPSQEEPPADNKEDQAAQENDEEVAPPRKSRSYFNAREIRSDDISMFTKWTGMLERYDAESHTLDDICGSDQYSTCKLKEWKEFLDGLRGAPLKKQLHAINRFINKYPYVDDIVNWGVKNYWETPYEFQRKSGNCKDYSIAKFMSLRALGVPGDKMRLEVVRDLNLGGVIHAVLVVFEGKKAYMLDNQIKQVMLTDQVYHYVPIYSINEQHWWRHLAAQ